MKPAIKIKPDTKFWAVLLKVDTALREAGFDIEANQAYSNLTPLREASRGTWLEKVGEYVDVEIVDG